MQENSILYAILYAIGTLKQIYLYLLPFLSWCQSETDIQNDRELLI